MKRFVAASAIGLTLLAAVACSTDRPSPVGPTMGPPRPSSTAVLVGAGDIADCNNDGGRHAEETARLLDRIEGVVFAAGDLVYPDGSAAGFQSCYEPRWGRHKRRTRPAPGNHEYMAPAAFPYFNYFGPIAGPEGDGFYSFTLGNWHVISLNSNVPATTGSVQWSGCVTISSRTGQDAPLRSGITRFSRRGRAAVRQGRRGACSTYGAFSTSTTSRSWSTDMTIFTNGLRRRMRTAG